MVRICKTPISFWLKGIEEQKLIQSYENGYIGKPEIIGDIKALEKAGLEVLDSEEFLLWRPL